MKTSLVLFVMVWAALPLYAQQVILDLDKGYPEDQFYFITYNAESAINLKSNADGYDGKSAAMRWEIKTERGGLGYAGFGYLHTISETPFPDLTPYTHLSLWYNNVEPASQPGKVTFRFELHEHDTETSDGQVWIYESDEVLKTPSGWTELKMPLVQVDELGEDGFAIPPGGSPANGTLDLDQIKHWAILLLIEGEPAGTALSGTTRFDYLTAENLPQAAEPIPEVPHADVLHANYPNPFSESTTLAYTLRQAAHVSLTVYDMLGREVAVLIDRQQHAPGLHEVGLSGAGLAAGAYLYVLNIDGTRSTRTMIHR